MIAQFQTIDDNNFKINGTPYFKVFIAKKVGNNSVQVVCAYDSKLELLKPTHFSDVEVNGKVYGSADELILYLKDVVFRMRDGGSGGDGGNGATDLNYMAFYDKGIVVSSTGADAVVPLANNNNAGLLKGGFLQQDFWIPKIRTSQNADAYNVVVSGGSYKIIGDVFHYRIAMKHITSKTKINSFTYIDLPEIGREFEESTNSTLEQIFLGSGQKISKIHLTPQITLENGKMVIYFSEAGSLTFSKLQFSSTSDNSILRLSGTIFLE